MFEQVSERGVHQHRDRHRGDIIVGPAIKRGGNRRAGHRLAIWSKIETETIAL